MRVSRAWRAASALLVLIACILALVPLAPAFPFADVDSAWAFAINAAVGHHLVFGRDVVFTFGPYASVYTRSYTPATDDLALAGGALLAASFTAGLLAITASRGRALAVLFALTLCLLPIHDPIFFAAPAIFLILAARPMNPPRRWADAALFLLVPALALLPLIKGTFTAAVLAGFGLGCLLLLRRGRWGLVAAMVTTFPVAMLFAWIEAGQSPAALPGFFMAQSDIVDGYTQAMALSGPRWQLAVFLSAALALFAPALRPAWRAGFAGLTVLVGIAFLLAIAFKAGFVRQDMHVDIAAGALALLAILLTIAAGSAGRLQHLGLLAGVGGWLALAGSLPANPAGMLARLPTSVKATVQAVSDRLHGGAMLRQHYDQALAAIRDTAPLPDLPGAWDIYSVDQSLLLAWHKEWSPRPIPQSYSAYSKTLADLNAAHLVAPDAPRNVLFDIHTIDNRLPAFEDAPSWIALLDRYQAVGMIGDMAVLTRRAGARAPARPAPPAPTSLSHAALGAIVALDPGVPTWAVIDVRPTLLGRLASLVFRPPPIDIVLRTANGGLHRFRYVPGIARAGFLLSPMVATAAQLVALQIPAARVFDDFDTTAFSIEGNPRYWRRDYAVSLAALPVPPAPASIPALFATLAPIVPDAGGGSAVCYVDLRDGHPIDHAAPLNLSGLVRLNGWGFGMTGSTGVEPDAVSIVLQRQDGTALGVPASFQDRVDVGPHFHQPQLIRVGFQALVDLRRLSGSYTLALAMTRGDRHWFCPLIAPLNVMPAQPEPHA